jgi:antitoxin ChpS
MLTTHLRKVGGSVMLAVPPAFLEHLNLKAGASVGLMVADGHMVVHPHTKPSYSLEELLAPAVDAPASVPQDREWLDAPAVGGELM